MTPAPHRLATVPLGHRHGLAAALAMGLLLTLVGCDSKDPIQVYDAPKDARPGMPDVGSNPHASMGTPPMMSSGMAQAAGQRIIAVTIPQGRNVWFVKLMGPADGIETVRGELEGFLETIRFEDGEPGIGWTAPDTWRTLAPGMFATAKWALDEPGTLIASLTKLTLESFGDEDLLANVNRWRGQIGLSPVDIATLRRESRTVVIDGVESTRVDLDGSKGAPPGTKASPPSAAGGSRTAPPSNSGQQPPAGSLAWTLPDGISEGSGSAMRVATFVAEAAPGVDISVTKFPGDVGGVLANVNRWRGQAGLPPVGAAELEGAIERLDVPGLEVVLVDAPGTQTRILAALVPGRGETWFVKASGPAAASGSMAAACRELLGSLSFDG